MKEKEIKTVCQYNQNYDCVCRSGMHCGGYHFDETHFPSECPYYKPVNIKELDNIVTRIMNECEACPRHRSNGGNCTTHKCKKYTAIEVLTDLKLRFKRRGRLNK